MSINEQYYQVKQFHEAFNHPVEDKPTRLDWYRAKTRADWMNEEIDEFLDAVVDADLYMQVDSMIDLIYFALGTLVELGVPPEKIFNIVQKANMDKLWEDGKPKFRENGKVIKPPTWKDPYDELVKAIDEMGYDKSR